MCTKFHSTTLQAARSAFPPGPVQWPLHPVTKAAQGSNEQEKDARCCIGTRRRSESTGVKPRAYCLPPSKLRLGNASRYIAPTLARMTAAARRASPWHMRPRLEVRSRVKLSMKKS